jgi:DNA replication and repair protein RecF
MHIKSLTVKNFRNYADRTIEPNKNLNIFAGENAQGKTNLVEAVFLCCVARSPRADADKELIKWGCDEAYVKLVVTRREGDSTVEIVLSRLAKKQIKINGVPLLRAGELMGTLNAVFFSPDEIRVIRQSPADRRRFMDIDLSQSDKNYFYSLNRYNKILQQRNNLLKTTKESETLLSTLPIWDSQLVREGVSIIKKRKEFICRLKVFANDAHRRLTRGAEDLEISYQASIKGDAPAELAAAFEAALRANYERDYRLGHTGAGPHRDDIKIAAGSVDIRTYGSNGQQRTAALSLKLAELRLFEDMIGEYPVLLLDDVLSELDEGRQRQLFKEITGVQTLMTVTRFDPALVENIETKIFHIAAETREDAP